MTLETQRVQRHMQACKRAQYKADEHQRDTIVYEYKLHHYAIAFADDETFDQIDTLGYGITDIIGPRSIVSRTGFLPA